MMNRSIFTVLVSIGLAVATAQAGVVFQQDFSGSSTVGDYVSVPNTSSQFDAIGVTAGGTVSVGINSGTLQYNVAPDDPTPQGYGGFVWKGDTSSNLDVMALQMAMTIDTGGFFNNNNEIQISMGGFTASTVESWNLQSMGADTAKAYVVMQNNAYIVKFGTGEQMVLSNGATANVGMYVNRSGASTTFLGDDGLMHSLDNNSKSLFVNGTLVANNLAVDKISSLQGLRVTTNIRGGQNVDNGVFQFDNIVISDTLPVPEPATMGLLLVGGLAALRRRKK